MRLVRNQVRRLVRLGLKCVEEEEEEKEGGREGEGEPARVGGRKAEGGREGGREEGRVYREFEGEVMVLLSLLTRLVKSHEAPWLEALRVRLDYNGYFSR